MSALLSEMISHQHAMTALQLHGYASNADIDDARPDLPRILPTSAPSLSLSKLTVPAEPTWLAQSVAPSEPAEIAPRPDYPKLLGIAVLATHVASLASQLASSLSPYIAPDLFARWANEMVCILVRPGQARVARAASCKVLRIGKAVFTPGMMVAPYFALLALGDLVCWGLEVRNPGSLPFQGDSLANLIGWIDTRGGFTKLCDILGPSSQKADGEKGTDKATIRERVVTSLLDKVRKALAQHDDPKWQKSIATQIRRASAAAFVILIARLPFSDDTTSLPAGLLDFYGWLEKAGAATKAAAAGAESLVKPPAPQTCDDGTVDDDADLQSIRIDPRASSDG
ncbi:hypothetical protein [Pandoraea aquatica]|nr:hypothetical protein [Pandoraea aquatica]